MALSGEDQLRIVLFSVGAAFLILISFTAAWFCSARFCPCCRRVKPVGRPRKDIDPEQGIELVDNTALNTNKDSKQKSENDAIRERAMGAGHPHNSQYSMAAAAAGLGAGHPKPPRTIDKSAFEPRNVDELVFDADDLPEYEEMHPHEVKKTAPVPPKSRNPTRTSR